MIAAPLEIVSGSGRSLRVIANHAGLPSASQAPPPDSVLSEHLLQVLERHARRRERVAPRRGIVLLDDEMFQARERGVSERRLEIDVTGSLKALRTRPVPASK